MSVTATSTSVAAALVSTRCTPYKSPMPTKKSAVSRKRTAIEEEILRVAADKFGKQGYQATTLDEIAAAAGISRAAFYLYFPNKEELLRRIYSQVIATSQAAIEQIVAEKLPVSEKLRRIIRHQVRYMATNIPLAQVFFSEIFNLRPELGQWVKRANRAFGTVIERVVSEGVQTGELIPLHPKQFTYALMGMCNWMHRWYRPGGEWTPDTVAEEFIRILESGYLTQKVEHAHAPCASEIQALRREVTELKSMMETLVRAAQSDRTRTSWKSPRPSSNAG
jgi:AcrR family transcriptional regulator